MRQQLNVLAFRAADGLVSLLQDEPLASWQFMFGAPKYPAGGIVRPGPIFTNPPIGLPSDIAGVTAEGVTWYLDPRTGRVTSQDVGAQRKFITSLGVRGTVRTACTLQGHAIAFLDDERPGYVFVRDIDPPYYTRQIPFPPGLVDGHAVKWTHLRFGGSVEGPCLLWTPRMPTVIIVSDSSVHALGPFVEPPIAESFFTRIARYITRSHPPPNALDATSFPGGIAILHGGRSPYAGRLVDFYSDTGTYIVTMRLPRPALRVAGSRHRLFVLSQDADSVLLASYVLPASIRSNQAPREPEAFVPRVVSQDGEFGDTLLSQGHSGRPR